MQGNQPISTISGAGGDYISSPKKPDSSRPSQESLENHDHQHTNLGKHDLGINYANYGDPYSFIPYQLILIVADFVFNWTMDFAHEDSLAILVIFV